jgi:hypothetical protein
VNRRRPYSRHGLNAAMARVSLRSFTAIDRRTVAARGMLAFRDDLVSALGGDAALSPQRRKLVDLAARASLYLDHLDAWLGGQRSLIRQRSVLPALVQRQALADHLARLLDKLDLDRAPRKVPTLDEYVSARYAATGGGHGIPTGAGADASVAEPMDQGREGR